MAKNKNPDGSGKRLNRSEYFKNQADRIGREIDRIMRKPNPQDTDSLFSTVHELTEKQKYFLEKSDHFSDSPFILSDSPDAIDRLKIKIEGLRFLSVYFQTVNKNFKRFRNLDGIRIPDFWKSQIETNLKHCGIPFPETYFSRIRRKIKFSSDRIKSIESARFVQSFTVNGVSVSVSHGRIIVSIPWKPGESLKTRMKNDFRLKWSNHSRAWVRKYTGQKSDWFDQLRQIFLNPGEGR